MDLLGRRYRPLLVDYPIFENMILMVKGLSVEALRAETTLGR